MARSKYDFIRELLSDKKIRPNQRERILKLAAKEIGNDGTLEERISVVENFLFNQRATSEDTQRKLEEPSSPGSQKLQDSSSDQSTNLPDYRDPSNVYKFLLAYNQNEILKSTCHDIDSDELDIIKGYCNTDEYNFELHFAKIMEAYESLEKRDFGLTYIKALIRGYLTGKGFKGEPLNPGWSGDRIVMNWSHPDLIKWCNDNRGFPPSPSEGLVEKNEKVGFEFSMFTSNMSGKPIQTFSELVIHFKHMFHVRRDNSLLDIISHANEKNGWADKIMFEIDHNNFPKNIELFADVDKLVQCYNGILDLIIENHGGSTEQKPNVRLSLCQSTHSVQLSIHQLDTIYGKSLTDTVERGIGRSYGNLIKKRVNGTCNLTLKADFGQGDFARVNLWDGKPSEAEKLDSFSGVEHILEFPKM